MNTITLQGNPEDSENAVVFQIENGDPSVAIRWNGAWVGRFDPLLLSIIHRIIESGLTEYVIISLQLNGWVLTVGPQEASLSLETSHRYFTISLSSLPRIAEEIKATCANLDTQEGASK